MFCKQCEYDLRGTPGDVCPECGRPFDRNDSDSYLRNLEPSYGRTVAIVVVVLILGNVITAGMMTWDMNGPLPFSDGWRVLGRFMMLLVMVPWIGLIGLVVYWYLGLPCIALLVYGLNSRHHRVIAPLGAVAVILYANYVLFAILRTI